MVLLRHIPNSYVLTGYDVTHCSCISLFSEANNRYEALGGKITVSIANNEDPDQTAHAQSGLDLHRSPYSLQISMS